MKFKKLGRKGQILPGAMSLGYSFLLFGVSLIALGIVLMAVSDTMLGIHLYSFAVLYNADPSILGLFESMRKAMPFISILSFFMGMIALAFGISSIY